MSSPFAQPQQPPNRLSIGHLMLWTAMTALFLAFYRTAVAPEIQNTSFQLYVLVQGLFIGIQWAGVLTIAWRIFRRKPGQPSQPGHWLLFVEGTQGACACAGYGILQIVRPDLAHSVFGIAAMFPAEVIAVVGNILAIILNRKAGRVWVAGFGVLAAFHFLFIPAVCVEWIHMPFGWLKSSSLLVIYFEFAPGIVALGLLIAATVDACRFRRDIFHWAGVVSVIGIHTQQFAQQFIGFNN